MSERRSYSWSTDMNYTPRATEALVLGGASPAELETKADKVSGAVEGNLAGLDGNGNLTDSGISAADVAAWIVNTQTVTIPVDEWSGGSATVEAVGVAANSTVWVCPQSGSAAVYTSCGVRCSAQAEGSLTFSCDGTPDAAITVEVIII